VINMTNPVLIPLLNPNEPEALITDLFISEGQLISKGDPVCILETTKSSAELVAETAGYVRALRFSKGQSVRAGEILCYLAPNPDWQPTEKKEDTPTGVPQGLRISQPALKLARSLKLDLGKLPVGPIITQDVVRAFSQTTGSELPATKQRLLQEDAFDPTAILIYGGGGHGKMVIDLLRARAGYRIVGIVDDGLTGGDTIMGVPILGDARILPQLHDQGVRLAINAVGGIGNIGVRIKIFERLAEAGFTCPAVAHPTAYLDPSASLSAGSQVMALAYLGSEVRLGYGCIINTGAIISHDCQLQSYANISPGAILAGDVRVGESVLIGMGVTINLGVKIGQGARIGNGATVKSDVPAGGIVRAGAIWPA
jgi:acetyltransferase EpsM